MARKKRKKTNGPDPINLFLDLAGAVTLGLVARHQVIKDYEKGQGEESAKAGTVVFGLNSLRCGSKGLINSGGLIGLNSGIKEIQRREKTKNTQNNETKLYVDKATPQKTPPLQPKKLVRKNMWREHCEDGSKYNLDPLNFISPDDYSDALNEAKNQYESNLINNANITKNNYDIKESKIFKEEKKYKCIWHKYCSDGSAFGLNPEDFDNPDDYEEAIDTAKKDINKNK